MKTTRWFKTGEPVPKNAIYIKTENKVVGYEEAPHALLDDYPIYEEVHLYEIQLEDNEPKHGPHSDIWHPGNEND